MASATVVAAAMVLAGWWVLGPEISVFTGRLNDLPTAGPADVVTLDGPLGVLLLAAGQWVFVTSVADGLYPQAPILVSGTIRWAAGITAMLAALYLGGQVVAWGGR